MTTLFAFVLAATYTITAPQMDEARYWLVRDYTNATEKIQAAIDSAAKDGGGTVCVQKGFHEIRGLRLRSNVTLYLEAGAILSASRRAGDFRIFTKNQPWEDAILVLRNERNVSVIGEKGSIIDGNNGYNPEGEENYRGVHGVSAYGCSNLVFRGYAMRHTGNWAHNIDRSTDLRFENLTVLAGHDGVHIQSCDRVTIADCRIETGDDAVAGCDNQGVVVRNCRLSSACQIFRFGGSDVVVEDCTAVGPCPYVFRGSLSPQAKRDGLWNPRYVPGRHSTAAFFAYMAIRKTRRAPERIVIRNCRVENCVRLLRYNFEKEPWQEKEPLRALCFENVTATGLVRPMTAQGGDPSKDAPFALEMKNCTLAFPKGADALIEGGNVASVALDGVSVEGVTGPLFRSWAGEPNLSCTRVSGIETRVEKATKPFACPPR